MLDKGKFDIRYYKDYQFSAFNTIFTYIAKILMLDVLLERVLSSFVLYELFINAFIFGFAYIVGQFSQFLPVSSTLISFS